MGYYNIPWTEADEQFLKDHADKPMEWIVSQLNRTATLIQGKYKHLGVPRQQKVPFSKEEKEFVEKNKDTMTSEEMSKKINRSISAIQAFITKNRLLRDRPDRSVYFNRACDGEYAYVLGFLFADGSVKKEIRRTYISLQSLDGEYVLPFFKNVYPFWKTTFLQGGGNRVQQLALIANNKNITDFLCDEWEFHKKSFYMCDKFFNYIVGSGEEYQVCFLRGFFDGDGYANKDFPYAEIAKRVDFDWTNILKLLPDYIPYHFIYRRTAKSSGSRLIMNHGGPQFFQYIYNSAFSGALPRKKERVMRAFEKPYFKDKYGPLMHTIVETL